MKKLSVLFSKVALIGINLLDRALGMETAGNTKGQIATVMVGGRRHFCGQNKPITGIDSGVFFETEVRDIVFHRPVRFEIAGEFEDISVFVQIARWGFSFLFFLFQPFFAEGMAGRFHQAGVNGYAFVDGQALGGKLCKEFIVDSPHGIL